MSLKILTLISMSQDLKNEVDLAMKPFRNMVNTQPRERPEILETTSVKLTGELPDTTIILTAKDGSEFAYKGEWQWTLVINEGKVSLAYLLNGSLETVKYFKTSIIDLLIDMKKFAPSAAQYGFTGPQVDHLWGTPEEVKSFREDLAGRL